MPLPKNKNELTDEEQQWYDWAQAVSMKHNEGRYVISWWVSSEHSVDTPFVNRMLNRCVKKGHLTKETKPGIYTKFFFNNSE